jgi:hypothetical protein
MKVHQIISENSDIEEAPMGILSKLGNKVASKIPGLRGGANAKLDVGNDANEMKNDLKIWMAGSGIKKGQLSVDDFKNFLTQKGLPTDKVDNMFSQMRQNPNGSFRTGGMSNKEVDAVLHKVVQLGFKDQGAGSRRSRFAPQTGTPPAPTSGQDLNSIVSRLTPQQKAQLKAML